MSFFFPAIWNSGSYQQCLKYILENRENVVSANSSLPLQRVEKSNQKTFSGKGWPYGDQSEEIFQEGIL